MHVFKIKNGPSPGHMVLNHSSTTGVHDGTHYYMLLVKFQTCLILKLL